MDQCFRAHYRRAVRARGSAGVIIILLLIVIAAAAFWYFKMNSAAQPSAAPPATQNQTPEITPSAAPGAANAKRPSGGGLFDELSNSPAQPPSPASAAPHNPTPAVPAAPPVDLKARAGRSIDAYLQAKAAATARLRSSPAFQLRFAEVDALDLKLKEARLKGTPQEKLNASAAWNNARLALDKEMAAAIAADPVVKKLEAEARLDAAAAQVPMPK